MNEITTRSISPYKEVCFIQSIFPDGSVVRGSGTITGNNDVLTALHVIYDAEYGGKAVSVTVTPGAFVNANVGSFSAPLGTYSANSWTGISGNWDTNNDGLLSASESGRDLAVVTLDVNISSLTGALAISSQTGNFLATVDGYPARGTGLMEDSGIAVYYDQYPIYRIDVGLGAGASGGPMLQTVNGVPVVRGVLSAGDAADTYSIYAALTKDNATWVNSTSAANDGLIDASTAYRSIGLGISSGSDNDDTFIQARLSYDSSNSTTVYGYKGADQIWMRGYSTSYSIQSVNGDTSTLFVTDAVTGQKLYLHDVNALVFQDKTTYIMDADQAQIARLYTVFDRVPDFDGLKYWTNLHASGTSFTDIAQTFAQTQEFATRYNSVSNSGFAEQLYSTILGRNGDASGVSFWTSQLDHGMSRGEAMVQFTNSVENQQLTQGASGFIQIVGDTAWTNHDLVSEKGVVFGSKFSDSFNESQLWFDSSLSSHLFGYQGGDTLHLQSNAANYTRTVNGDTLVVTNTTTHQSMYLQDVNMLSFQDKNVFVLTEAQASVARLYTIFDRVPDFDGLNYWYGQMAHGMTFKDIANTFAQTNEFATLYSAVDNRSFATQLYTTVLGRAADAQGLDYWTGRLDHGMGRGEAMVQFTDSVENQHLTAGTDGFIQIVGQTDWA